jgi:hypothetical protein
VSTSAGRDAGRAARLDELGENPRPSVSRAALAVRYPAWGAVTMSLLVVGLVVAFLSLRPLASALGSCAQQPAPVICVPQVHATVVALPVAAMLAGLAVSLIGGRVLARFGRRPLVAGIVGWVVFAAGVLVAFGMAGLL